MSPRERYGRKVETEREWRRAGVGRQRIELGSYRAAPASDASPGLAGSRLDRLEATPLLRRRLGEPYVGPSRVCVSFQLQRTNLEHLECGL